MNENNIKEKIAEFGDKWSKKNSDKAPAYCHNIYYLVSEDIDGNITNEMFAINCMTDYAFNRFYVNGDTSSWSKNLYVGQGTSIPVPSSKAMESFIPNGTATSISYGDLSNMRYHSQTGILSAIYQLYVGYFDYTSFSEDVTVTEIGFGSSTTNLFFHARVYDSEGNPSSFIKKMYEKLTIYVYASVSCKIGDIINRNYSKGIITFLRPELFFKVGAADSNINSVYCSFLPYYRKEVANSYVGGYNMYTGSAFNRTLENNVATANYAGELMCNNYFISDKFDYIDYAYISDRAPTRDINYNWYAYHSNNFLMMYPVKLDTPEKITCYNLFTNSNTTDNISDIFCAYNNDRDNKIYGHLPCVDFDVSGEDSGMWMYNCQTKEWDISENFVNSKNCAYNVDRLVHSSTVPSYYFEDTNSYSSFRVFFNTRPDIPITSLNVTGKTFYATDSFWDTSTWEIIANVASIPVSLQNKRYYCTKDTSALYSISTSSFPDWYYGSPNYQLKVTRDQTPHSIIPKTDSLSVYYGEEEIRVSQRSSDRGCGKIVSNDEYGYCADWRWLIYPGTNDPNPSTGTNASATDNHYWYKYDLKGINNDTVNLSLIWNTTIGDKIVTAGTDTYKQGFRVYYPNQDPSIAPTYEDYLFDVAWSNTYSYIPHFSFSDNGFVAVTYTTTSIRSTTNVNRTYILDLYAGQDDNTPELSYIDGYMNAHIIDLTNYICGVNVDVSDHVSIDIIDMKTKAVYNTIDLPEGYAFSGICGYDDFVYIRAELNGIISTFLYVISTDRLVQLDFNYPQMQIGNDSYKGHIQRAVRQNGNCESCMVMMTTKTDSYNVLFKSSDPENPIRIINNGTDSESCCNCEPQAAQLRYTNNGKQLLLTFSCNRSLVVDIGRILNEGTQSLYQTMKYNFPGSAISTSDYTTHWELAILGNSIIQWCHYRGSDYIRRIYGYQRPIERWVPHKVTGYTRTINSYNNPKMISGISGVKVQVSNDITKFNPVV